jgi:hypothetical protein
VLFKYAYKKENEFKLKEREPDNSCQEIKEVREDAAYLGK